MEYVIGSLITLLSIFIAKAFLKKDIKKLGRMKIMSTQSYLYEITDGLLYSLPVRMPKETHATKLAGEDYTKVLVINNEAYWIADNAVYVADIIDGEAVEGSARKVDTMAMDDVQLKKIMFVVKTLTEE